MEIYEIQNLNCKVKENRKKLAREVSTLFGRDSALNKEQIKKAAKSISKKYKFRISQVIGNSVFVDTRNGYSEFKADSEYEMYAKFILLSYEHYKLSKMEVKRK